LLNEKIPLSDATIRYPSPYAIAPITGRLSCWPGASSPGTDPRNGASKASCRRLLPYEGVEGDAAGVVGQRQVGGEGEVIAEAGR
jgi:hypothetical protein